MVQNDGNQMEINPFTSLRESEHDGFESLIKENRDPCLLKCKKAYLANRGEECRWNILMQRISSE